MSHCIVCFDELSDSSQFARRSIGSSYRKSDNTELQAGKKMKKAYWEYLGISVTIDILLIHFGEPNSLD